MERTYNTLKNSNGQAYNLDIKSYSFDEILNLFEITDYDFSLEELKRAKKKVLMTHPDKSRLSPEYFLFYKKAFEIIFHYYEDNHKQNQEVKHQDYNPKQGSNDFNKATEQKIKSTIKQLNAEDFNKKFNELYDKNMSKKIDTTRNQWFQENGPLYEINEPINKVNMNTKFENLKKQNHSLIKHNEFQHLTHSSGISYHEDEESSDEYLSSDPFSRLKFDDLRKVHKDQTIFSVGENDYEKIQKFNNVEQYGQARKSQDLTPLEQEHSRKLLEEQARIMKEKMARKQYETNLRTQEYEQKNKQVLSSFLYLR
jgi:hypothetical protein